MPTYEYKCENCGYEFEKFQGITSRALHKCPKCRKNGIRRLIGTGAGIIFKGSGFYQTDYRSDGYKQAEKSEKDKTAPDKDTKSPTKPESKPKEKKKSD
jgi:putative FmdB family regulatory protein